MKVRAPDQPALVVKIEHAHEDFALVPADEAGQWEQAVRVTVNDGERTHQHVIVSQGVGPQTEAPRRLASMMARFPDRHASVATRQREGDVALISAPGDGPVLLAAAAAAAVIARSWAWDESPEIAVSVTTTIEIRYVLDPVSSDGQWIVRLV